MTTSLDPSCPPQSSNPAPRWCAIVVILLTILAAWPLIFTGNVNGRGASDDLLFHWPTIQTFADQLPTPDLSSYQSATTPGYHLELAVIHRLGASRMIVQLYASLWTIILTALLAWRAGKAFGRAGVILCLPFLASMYCLFPSIWLLPDNAGWLCVLLLMLLALEYRPSLRVITVSGVVLIALVVIRQSHIWAAVTLAMSAWVGTQTQVPAINKLFSDLVDRTSRLLPVIFASIPAGLILLYFMYLWQGLVPPPFQNNHQSTNLITPAFILTQVAILSFFFLPILMPQLKKILKSHRAWWIDALVFGFIVGALPPASYYAVDQGRYSGWWNIIAEFPVIADRSPVIVLGAPIGALFCVLWCTMVSRRDAWILAATLAAFAIAQSANHASWQRYHEPMLIITGIIILTRAPAAIRSPKRVYFGCIALTIMLAAITIPTLINAQPVETEPQTQTNQITHPTIQSDHISTLSQQIP
ncbi:MAG: hypothetical protein JJ974_02825 [Phycisphaerales bacterium]|nr:hypothetical protein [Phycisphaerales bacterium]